MSEVIMGYKYHSHNVPVMHAQPEALQDVTHEAGLARTPDPSASIAGEPTVWEFKRLPS